jgi:diguanylate cyclase (GGDEF)-like protein
MIDKKNSLLVHDATAQEVEAIGQLFERSTILIITNEQGKITFVNEVFAKSFGLDVDAARGQELTAYISNAHEALQATRSGNVWRGALQIDDAAVYVNVIPFDEQALWIGYYIEQWQMEKHHTSPFYDQRTGLFSYSQLLHAMSTLVKKNRPFVLLSINLDRFKFINDLLGYEYGDVLLKQVANRLKNVFDSHILAHYQQDQFFLIVETDEEKKAETIAKQILQLFMKPFQLEHHELTVSPSIGISFFPKHSDNVTTLMTLADLALETVKESGGNGYCFYTNEIKKMNEEKLYIQNSIRKALENNEFTLYYQPIIDISSGNVDAVEALIRWNHPKLGPISPATFIPIAEETNLIQLIGDWVLREVCRQSKEWKKKNMPHIQIAVNISIKQFLQADLVQSISNVLQTYNLDPFCLKLEITESMAMHHMDYVRAQLQSLKELGIQLAIDDFGTGYSSLSYLKKLPVDMIKIDRTFIQDMVKHSYDLSIVRAVIQVAHSLNMKVVAEGVETSEQLKILRSERCDKAQGYYFSKPLLAKELEQLLQNKMKLEGRSQ